VGRVVTQTVGQTPTTEVRIRYQASACEIFGVQSGIRTGFSPSTRTMSIPPVLRTRLYPNQYGCRKEKRPKSGKLGRTQRYFGFVFFVFFLGGVRQESSFTLYYFAWGPAFYTTSGHREIFYNSKFFCTPILNVVHYTTPPFFFLSFGAAAPSRPGPPHSRGF